MKRLSKLLSLCLMAVTLVGCSCKKDDVVDYTLKSSREVFESKNKNLSMTTKEIYDYIRENESSDVNKTFLKYLMGQVLDLENNATNKAVYDLKIEKHFKETYLNSDTYKINGVFNEDLLAAELEAKLYVVDKVNLPSAGITYQLGLKYDYSDYITRALDYDVYLEMLKGKYINEVKPSIIDNSRSRIISIYSEDNLEDMMELVDDLFAGKYESLEALTTSKKDEEIAELGRQYCQELGMSNEYHTETTNCEVIKNNSTYDTVLKKFTVCENGVRCHPSEGLEYQVKLVREKEYITEKIVNKNTTGILYDEALSQLFRENVEDYLHKVIDGEDYFMSDWLYNSSPEFSKRDIILTEGPDMTCYLVTVRVVDSQTQNIEDKEAVLDLLLDKVSDSTVISYYLETLNVKVNDPVLQEYYDNLIGR